MIIRSIVAFACVLSAIASFAVAEDPPVAAVVETEKTSAPPTAEQIAEWIAQLDHDGFNIRQAAQQKLEDAGEAALAALSEAALGESQEAATRAVDILRKRVHGEDDSLKQAAQAALTKITKSDNAIAARRAEAALQSPAKAEETPADPPATPVPFGRGGIRIGGGGAIQIQVHSVIGGGKGRSISVKNVDGNKEINVEEDGRKIKIEESAAGKIKMSVTEKVDGKDETKSYEAESADDLKKVQPEAHKIYEQYKQGGGIGRIEFRAVPLDPARIRIAPGVPGAIPADRLKRIEEAKKRLEETRKRLEGELPKAEPEADQSSAIQQLDEAIKQLEATRGQLEKAAGGDNAAAIKQALEGLETAKKQLEDAKAKLAE